MTDVTSDTAVAGIGTVSRTLGAKLGDVYNVSDWGAVGNGVTNDAPNINAAILAISQAGGGVLTFNGFSTYYLGGSILLYPNVSLDGQGCTLKTDQGIYFMNNACDMVNAGHNNGISNSPSNVLAQATVSANPTIGGNTLTVTSAATTWTGSTQYDLGQSVVASSNIYTCIQAGTTAASGGPTGTGSGITDGGAKWTYVAASGISGFGVGDTVALRLGNNAYDSNEARYTALARIIAINSSANTITLDRYIPWNIAVTTAAVYNATIKKLKYYYQKSYIRNFNFESMSGATHIQGGIFLDYASDILIENITGNALGGLNMGTGLVYGYHSERLIIRNLKGFRNDNTIGQGSFGRLVGFGNCLDCSISDSEMLNHAGSYCFVESYCERMNFHNSIARHPNWSGSSTMGVMFLTQNSQATFYNTTFEYNNPVASDDAGGTASLTRFVDVNWYGAFPTAVGSTATTDGKFNYNDGTNSVIIDLNDLDEHEVTIPITNGLYSNFQLEYGLVREFELYMPSYAVGLNNCQFGVSASPWTYYGTVGAWDLVGQFVAGSKVRINATPAGQALLGSVYNPYLSFDNTTRRPQLLVVGPQNWAASTYYVVGQYAMNGGNLYRVAAATGDHLSAASGGPTGTSSSITDNHVTWAYVNGTGAAGYISVKYKTSRLRQSSGGTPDNFAETDSDEFRNRNASPFSIVSVGTATAGQTIFAVPGGYPRYQLPSGGTSTPRMLAFVNGVLNTNYTATDNRTITFGSGLTAGQVVTAVVIW